MLFLLGTHEVSWLGRTDVPLFISHRRLSRQRRWPRALGPWAEDSGGFSELSLFGKWVTAADHYASAVSRHVDEIGSMLWAAIQDWMCEPFMLDRTGLTLAEHQARTVDSYLELRELAPAVPWAPVIQGWRQRDYHDHVRQYVNAGVDLSAAPVVGVGSICRRQATDEAASILGSLAALGLSLHAFGLKTLGLRKIGGEVASADSMAWSLNARKNPPLAECSHRSCANCMRYALRWRDQMLADADRPRARQLSLMNLFATGGASC